MEIEGNEKGLTDLIWQRIHEIMAAWNIHNDYQIVHEELMMTTKKASQVLAMVCIVYLLGGRAKVVREQVDSNPLSYFKLCINLIDLRL